jgi:protein ImuB
MRLLFLAWPHLPLRLERARQGFTAEIVVLGGKPWEAGTVLDCSPTARRAGVRRGQPLGEAHKLVPEALFLPADPDHYRDALERSLDALSAFGPALEGESDPTSETFGQAYLGVEGLERLWGGETRLRERVIEALAPLLPGPPRAGYGNGRFGARVAALVGRDIPLGDPVAEAAVLAPHPVRLLTADEEIRIRFASLGLRTVGDVARLPRSAVLARFGAEGGELHDLANGLDRRPLVPRRPVERLRAEAELDPPVDSIEPLRFVLHHLCGALCEQLAARGSGAGRARLELELEGSADQGPAVERIEQTLPEPVALADLVERLLLARIETAPPSQPIVRLALELDGVAPAATQQLGLFTPQSARAGRLDWQLAALCVRFGSGRLYRARLGDPGAILADDRVAWLAAGNSPTGGRPG